MAKIIIEIYRIFQSRINGLKKYIARKAFLSNCVVGENFSCQTYSKCVNNTGKRESIKIGDNCEIHGSLVAKESGTITIGYNTTIRFHSQVFAINRIEIGNYVIISNNVTIYDNNNHPVEPERRMEMSKNGFYGDLWEAKHSQHAPIKICDNVWIGERVSILKGVTIGKGSVVAMGSIVTKDVPEYSIVAGNPAKIVKYLR